MLGFIVGVLLTAVLYTFFPVLAVYPSGWLRSGLVWIRSKREP